ncbi:MAG TPA: type I methionyl aminopeptidase [Candidatus Cloacimonas acidaminovorans]|jgi:methionyl aminopeptidase|nr:type I methionyl aminopeptidase [Candidatus Cloacimonas acidaminovorans]HOI02452.1 type I methionyl aminopeptidase [Candidatus Cloacimonas acidaminovorans]HPX57718.1 type I methionyl aminopeptidase [Candidatus Cloacimonas acidaminovorans]HQC08741.1 type I methionyl aminopeptidase [Candidatus Cloacimonas acidaminovorans]
MIYIKTPAEIEKMRKSCRIIGELLDALETIIRPGISTLEIDKFAEDFIGSRGGKPSFKGYRVDGLPPFPGSICASVNEQIVHGIPSAKKILQDGDIIGIDVGVVLDGYNGDAARTYRVGKISAEAEELLQVTKEALERGISAAIPGNRVGDISYAIGSFVAFRGYYVADNLTGHGVGRNLHEEPQIPNTGKPGRGPRLSAGMTLAIEPMVNIGTNRVLENGWEFKVADNSLSAHFEHTILVTDNKPEILTVAD